MNNIKPLPGYMFVKLEAFYQDTGLIKIPKRYQKTPHLIGRITAINMRLEDHKTLGVELEPGNRIIVSPLGGRALPDGQWVYPITLNRKDERGKKYRDSGVLAIVPETVDLAPHSQEISRCQFCGQARPGTNQNLILWQGVCTRCGKDRNGEIPDKSLKVSDEEMEVLGKTG